MDSAFILSMIQTGEALPGVFAAFRGMRKDATSHPGAGVTYLAYQAAGTEALTALEMMVRVGVPPRVLGGLWSWPVVYRAHRSFVEAVTKLTVSFGQMVMLGNYDVVESAYGFGMAFVECMRDLPVVGAVLTRRILMTPEYEERVMKAHKALREFTLTARKDLDVPGRTEPLPEVGPQTS